MMKDKLMTIAAGILSISVLSMACKAKKSTAGDCAGFLVSYTKDVKPIVDANCANSCHSAANHAGGIDLSSYEKVKAISGQANFLGAVRHLAGYAPMPKKAPKLSDSTIKVLSCWVSSGAPQ